MIPDPLIVFFALGFFVSVLIGLTGMGGGALTTPVLILLGIPSPVAVGSDLAFTSVTRALGSVLHGRKSNIDFGLVKLILLGSIPATIASYYLLPYLRAELGEVAFGSLLTELLAFLLVAASIIGISRTVIAKKKKKMFLEAKIDDQKNSAASLLVTKGPNNSRNLPTKTQVLIIAAGALVGLSVQFTSVGSGTILIFLLMFLFRDKKIVGTDVFHAFILTSLGTLLHFGLGDVDPMMVLALVAGGIPGMFIGVRLLSALSFARLRDVLQIVIMGAGLTLIIHLIV